MREEIESLAAHTAIAQVIARYARAIDRMDWELLRSCYHPDAVEDRGRYSGPVDGFVEWLRSTLGALDSTWHLVGTPLIELDGDVAWVETYCLGVQRLQPDADGHAEVRHIPCRYCDRFERRGGDWRIARRVAVYEESVTAASATGGAPMGALPRRDREDWAYRREG
jgi:SnoaL-like domain